MQGCSKRIALACTEGNKQTEKKIIVTDYDTNRALTEKPLAMPNLICYFLIHGSVHIIFSLKQVETDG